MLQWDIPSHWGLIRLGNVAPEVSSQVKPKNEPNTTFNYWSLDAISQGQMDEPQPNYVLGATISSTCVSFTSEHVLYAKLRPYLNKVIVPSVNGIGSTEWVVLAPNPSLLDRKYLGYALRTNIFVQHMTESSAGARMPRARKDVLFDSQFPVPFPNDPVRSLETQKRIVLRLETLLGEVKSARELQESIEEDTDQLLDSVIRSTFDREENSGWQIDALHEVAYIQTGIAKGKRYGNQKLRELPYLRVANVQSGYLNLDEVKTIVLAESEIERYKLQKGDLLLTEGGDFDKLGRGAVWNGEIDLCVHQNHVFAVRFDQEKVLPEFAEYAMQSTQAKDYFVSKAKKTTNLASINKTQLSTFPLFYPSINKQKAVIERIDSFKREAKDMKSAQTENRELIEQLEQSFLSQAFRGEL